MFHKYKRVVISKELESVHEYPQEVTRSDFLEMINRWNALSLLQAKESAKVNYLYIAL